MITSWPLLEKAERAFRASELLLQAGNADFAASRTYYAYFYIAQALLQHHGLQFSSHGQVVAQFGNHFARTGLLDPSFHRLLIRAFNIRNAADYQVEVDIEEGFVAELLGEGRRFLAAAEQYLKDREREGKKP